MINNQNFPIATLADVNAHLARQKFSVKRNGSQAYHVFQMVDPFSVQMFSFNFLSRKFEYLRLAQNFSRSERAFSSFIRKNLQFCRAANQFFQHVHDLGTAAPTFEKFVDNLKAFFIFIEKAGLELTLSNCEFGLKAMTFLGNTITTESKSSNRTEVYVFLLILKVPKPQCRFEASSDFFSSLVLTRTKLRDKLLPYYELLRYNTTLEFTDDHHKCVGALEQKLKQACQLSLRLPMAVAEDVILAGASLHAAGYVLMLKSIWRINREHLIRLMFLYLLAAKAWPQPIWNCQHTLKTFWPYISRSTLLPVV